MGYVTNWRGVGADDITINPPEVDDGTIYDDGAVAAQDTSAVTYNAGSDWATVNGVCKPTNSGALGYAKDLQRAANRVLSTMGSTKIAVDGAIGPGTVAALVSIQGVTSAAAYSLGSSNINYGAGCTVVTAQIQAITDRLNQLADYLGASSSVSSPSGSGTPTIYDPVSGTLQNQAPTASILDAFNNMSTPMKIAAVGIAGGIGYLAFAKPKKRRRS